MSRRNKEDLEAKLPPPIQDGDEIYWLPLFKLGRQPPYGYAYDEDNPDWWKPVPHELLAIEKAKEYLKQYSLRRVAEWLVQETGRHISHVGLDKRIKRDADRCKSYRQSQEYVRRLQKAIEQTELLEQTIYGRREVTRPAEASTDS